MSLGSYLSLDQNAVNRITDLVSRVRAQDQNGHLDEDQIRSLRAEDINVFVIPEGPSSQSDDAAIGPHEHSLGLSPLQIRYLKDVPKAADRIIKKLRSEGFICKFDLEARKIDIREQTEGLKWEDALQIIKKSILEVPVPIPVAHLNAAEILGDVVLPATGPDGCEALVVIDGSVVKLVGLYDTVTKVERSLGSSQTTPTTAETSNTRTSQTTPKTVATSNTKVKVIEVPENSLTYLQNHKWTELTGKLSAIPDVKVKTGKDHIKLEGSSSSVDAAAEIIQGELEHLRTVEIELGSHANVADVAQLAQDIGQKYKCAISMRQTSGTIKSTPAPLERELHSSVSSSFAAHRQTKVQVVMNALEQQKADVIVNTTNSDLELSLGQGVSWCILQAAGQSIQTEVKQMYPAGIKHGEIAISEPGNLKTCKIIFHGSLPSFPNDQNKPGYKKQEDKCFEWMVSLVFNCLIKASEKGYRTVAFPALGTGTLEYPVQHVVQLMYKAVRLYNDDKRSGRIKEVIIVIYPKTKLEVKQFFLAHRQTHKLKTRHVATTNQIQEEKRKDDGQDCEIRVRVGNNLLQVVNSNIHDACNVTEAIIVLWFEHEIRNPGSNPGLKCIDPNKPEWKCTSRVSQLSEKRSDVDEITLPGKTLIHSYCRDNSDKSITDALVEGLRTTGTKNCNTVTIPIAFEGRIARKSKSSAEMIVEAVKTAATDIHVVTVAIEDDGVFMPFVSNLAAMFNNKFQEPADIDKSRVAVDLWEKTFSNMAAESTASLQSQLTMMSNLESVLVITASDFKTRLVEQEVKAKLSSRGFSTC